MVSYGNKYPRHNARPLVAKQSGQCARALNVSTTAATGEKKKQILKCGKQTHVRKAFEKFEKSVIGTTAVHKAYI